MVKNGDTINKEMDTTTKSVGELTVKPAEEEIKNIVDNSLKTE